MMWGRAVASARVACRVICGGLGLAVFAVAFTGTLLADCVEGEAITTTLGIDPGWLVGGLSLLVGMALLRNGWSSDSPN